MWITGKYVFLPLTLNSPMCWYWCMSNGEWAQDILDPGSSQRWNRYSCTEVWQEVGMHSN